MDLQRAPNAAAGKSRASGAANGSAGKPRRDDDDSEDSDDDGLGRIKSKQKKNALPAGLGNMFAMRNPLDADGAAATG